MKKVNNMTMKEWVLKETRQKTTTFWGRRCRIKPVIHPKKFGDGLQLAFLGTIDQRPDYWLIRIDSSIDMDADNFDYESHLLTPLEEHFGRRPVTDVSNGYEFQKLKKSGHWEISCYDNYKDYLKAFEYPHIGWSGGHWGMIVNFRTGKYEL